MTDIEQTALALVNDVAEEIGEARVDGYEGWSRGVPEREALCRAIEQHEAYKREVSDAVEAALGALTISKRNELLERFIIPKPVDHLLEVMEEADRRWRQKSLVHRTLYHFIREVMAERNLQITEIDRD